MSIRGGFKRVYLFSNVEEGEGGTIKGLNYLFSNVEEKTLIKNFFLVRKNGEVGQVGEKLGPTFLTHKN